MIHFGHIIDGYCWRTIQAFIWDQLHWSEVVSRYSRGKKRIKKGLKLDKKVSKTVIWSFSDTFFTYFWWILLRNITSFHLRSITLIWDGFEVFYGGKLIKKRTKLRQEIFKKLKIAELVKHFEHFFLINIVEEHWKKAFI